jgi:hypothetical protein
MTSSRPSLTHVLSALIGVTVGCETVLGQTRPPFVARTTAIPTCTVFADAASAAAGDGSVKNPHMTIAAAIESAKPGAVICVAEGVYGEQIKPGEKHFSLAGGFQRGKDFKVRDSAAYVSRAQGNGGGSFVAFKDVAPAGDDKLVVIDGFEITGYSQAIMREFWESQRFDLTNNFIHGNTCADESLAGASFALNNVSGTIRGNVIQKNSCGRGGGGFLNDSTNKNTVIFDGNIVDGNAGTEPGASHGGGLYFFGNTLRITNNLITNNTVTQWGGGLYVGAFTDGNQPTTATLTGNVYRGNRAGNSGGGFFCDDGATCNASNEVYAGNCGGNILVDGGGPGRTTMRLDQITSAGALDVGCQEPGIGFFVNTYEASAPDSYAITNAIFWNNAEGRDLVTSCSSGCQKIQVNISSSMVQTKYAEDGVKIGFGQGNIAPADPLFVAPEKGDFRLQPNSPAAGKGANVAAVGAATQPSAALTATPAPEAANPTSAEAAPPPAKPAQSAAQPTVLPADTPVARSKDDPAAKDAFQAAKELGTTKAWTAFLASYPDGFYGDLARAYLDKLNAAPADAGKAQKDAAEPVRSQAPTPAAVASQPAMTTKDTTTAVAALPSTKPAVARSASYMGFPEKFNRYYTDPAWKPSQTLFVSPKGGGDGSTRDKPMAVKDAIAAAQPGTLIQFLAGNYQGGYEFAKKQSGTYDQPIVLYAERKADNTIAVVVDCNAGKRKSCFNLEEASYIAIDDFELTGGNYGVRAVGGGFSASEHSRGIAVVNCKGHDQERDPFFTAQSDWAVFERNIAYGAKKGDGHGFYLSNGGDWNIVRNNETHSNASSDFQINADPQSTCVEVGIDAADPKCDAIAGEGEGGQGASDFFLVDGNYFHHGLGPGANFTSVRRSIIRNNIFGPQARHNVSFWQETENPKLGSSDNKIQHNLFITANNRHAVQFMKDSTRNEFANNIVIGITVKDGNIVPNPSAVLLEVDSSVESNFYLSNVYGPGTLEGRTAGSNEFVSPDFAASWFVKFPVTLSDGPNGFTPSSTSPALNKAEVLPDTPIDRNGTVRTGTVDAGPIEVK